MDNLKPKKIKQVNLRDFLKIGGFSSASIILFFIPIANKKVSLIYILADLIYLKCEKFVYFCLIVFIILLGYKEYFNKEKTVFTKLNIVLKAICVFILIILITRNELIFLKNYTLIKILKCMIFKITILFPVSAFFLGFLSDYGLLYIFDAYFSKFTKKFFRVSGKNLLIFCIFLFVDSFVGLYVTYSLYKQGRLRKNEAIISILNYPTLNIYLICHVSNRLKINIITLGLVLSIVFILTNLIICRVYPINNKQKIFLVKNKFKEKTFSKNKFKMAISLYLENKQKNKILSYFNEAINIVSNIMPVLLILFLFVDKIIINKDILNIAFSFYDRILIILKIPNYHYISKCITLGFFNPIYPIEAISCDVSFIARLIVAVILIGQGVFMSAVVFIKMNMSFITYRDILFVYLERILIMILIIFFAYYFYLGFSI